MFIVYLYPGLCFSFGIYKNKPFVLNVTFYGVKEGRHIMNILITGYKERPTKDKLDEI